MSFHDVSPYGCECGCGGVVVVVIAVGVVVVEGVGEGGRKIPRDEKDVKVDGINDGGKDNASHGSYTEYQAIGSEI